MTRQNRWWLLAIVGVACLSAGAIGATLAYTSSDEPSSPPSTNTSNPSASTDGYDFGSADPIITTDHFNAEIRVTEKECFGEAGCNVAVRIEPFYTGTLDDLKKLDEPLTVTYEIVGSEQTHINNFTISSEEIRYDRMEHLRVPSEGTELSVKIIEVF
ncbi:hypothetical protein AB8O38_01955 [Saccharomonospora xinjiangensis]|uniref:hypothetical protein n=1 Tax=Saccharomonospora xinjiangensis TaxID=75294 RepID=UPI00350EC9CF